MVEEEEEGLSAVLRHVVEREAGTFDWLSVTAGRQACDMSFACL